MSGPPRSSGQGMQKVVSSGSKVNGHSVHPGPNNIQRSGVSTVQDHTKVLAISALLILWTAIICEWKVSFNKAKWEASTTWLFPAFDCTFMFKLIETYSEEHH